MPRQRFGSLRGTLRALVRGAVGPAGSREAFERALEARFGVPVAVAVGSGRAALGLLLRGLDLPAGSGVALAALNFPPLLDVVRLAGARPVLVDVDPGSWTLSPGRLDEVLRDDPGIRAVVATHLFGNPCDIVALRDVCRRRGAVLLEDCAHGVLERAAGGMLGTFGAGALLSLEASKPLAALAGGVALCADPALADRVRRVSANLPDADGPIATVRRFARFAALSVATDSVAYGTIVHPLQRLADTLARRLPPVGRNSRSEVRKTRQPLRRLGDAEAAIGIAALARLEHENRRRRAVGAAYDAALPPSVERMAFGAEVPALLFFPVAVDGPERLRSRLLRRGIDTRLRYMEDCADGRCPVAARLSARMLCLPVWPDLPLDRARWIAAQVGEGAGTP